MTQEERQLLLKDLCVRLPYGVKAQVQGWDEAKEEEVNIPLKIYSINTDGYVYFESNDYDVTYCSIDACRLYLRPMSSMTEEEEKEYKSFFRIGEYTCGGSLYGEEYEYIDADSDDISQPTSLIDWLNAHHFDYRGLIKKGLALEAPNDMYKEK